MRSLIELIGVFSKLERRRLALLIAAITIAALVDAAGIASIAGGQYAAYNPSE